MPCRARLPLGNRYTSSARDFAIAPLAVDMLSNTSLAITSISSSSFLAPPPDQHPGMLGHLSPGG